MSQPWVEETPSLFVWLPTRTVENVSYRDRQTQLPGQRDGLRGCSPRVSQRRSAPHRSYPSGLPGREGSLGAHLP
ncbi:uncharacterized protein CMC5_059160 [Chondromyces crocatus]|uniref:Uncharacterized protein n=1 Tax=Chondromyces crocatus TaxID=52 RepID=A0A0K1ELL7_CHOCO|nr:uncharacterized protein CMC5_059160 [Chondromyces crocatus]